nr:MAG TPA: hypothetical protein [Caudoviricetes sp.]
MYRAHLQPSVGISYRVDDSIWLFLHTERGLEKNVKFF